MHEVYAVLVLTRLLVRCGRRITLPVAQLELTFTTLAFVTVFAIATILVVFAIVGALVYVTRAAAIHCRPPLPPCHVARPPFIGPMQVREG